MGVPEALGHDHGEVSSRETCSRKLSSAVPWRTPSGSRYHRDGTPRGETRRPSSRTGDLAPAPAPVPGEMHEPSEPGLNRLCGRRPETSPGKFSDCHHYALFTDCDAGADTNFGAKWKFKFSFELENAWEGAKRTRAARQVEDARRTMASSSHVIEGDPSSWKTSYVENATNLFNKDVPVCVKGRAADGAQEKKSKSSLLNLARAQQAEAEQGSCVGRPPAPLRRATKT